MLEKESKISMNKDKRLLSHRNEYPLECFDYL